MTATYSRFGKRMKKMILIYLASVICLWSAAHASDLISIAPVGAKVYFLEPENGQILSSTFNVKFGLERMGVAPAGVEKANTGHHHLLINLEELPNMKQSLPSNEHIQHFGGGQTEVELTLPPGEHSLQLLLGNHLHIPHEKPVISEKIRVIVK